jgi:hypothetical protein
LVVIATISIGFAWMMREFVLFGAFFGMGGVYLGLHGLGMILASRKPPV